MEVEEDLLALVQLIGVEEGKEGCDEGVGED